MTKAELLREQKKQEKLKAERIRLEAMREYEHQYEDRGYLCGIAAIRTLHAPAGRFMTRSAAAQKTW